MEPCESTSGGRQNVLFSRGDATPCLVYSNSAPGLVDVGYHLMLLGRQSSYITIVMVRSGKETLAARLIQVASLLDLQRRGRSNTTLHGRHDVPGAGFFAAFFEGKQNHLLDHHLLFRLSHVSVNGCYLRLIDSISCFHLSTRPSARVVGWLQWPLNATGYGKTLYVPSAIRGLWRRVNSSPR